MAKTKFNTNQINLGDESAIDLLISQNKAKIELAGNLQGLGVSADASTDTLEQLVYDVSTVTADTTRQKPLGVALKAENQLDEGRGDADRLAQYGYVIKNGWLFWLYRNDSNGSLQLRRFKLSAMDNSVIEYDNQRTITQTYTNVGSYNVDGSDTGASFIFNDDGSHVYIMNTNSIKRYDVSGYDTDTLTVDTTAANIVTYTPKFDYSEGGGYESVDIYKFDVNAAETQMIIVSWHDGEVGIYDMTSSGDQNLTIIATGRDPIFFSNNSNNNLIEVYIHGDTYQYDINVFTIVNNQLNLVSTVSYQAVNINYWGRGFKKYKDLNNNYKIIVNLANTNSDEDPTFLLIDCATTNVTPIFSKLNYIHTNNYDYNVYTPTITVIDNRYYLFAGMWIAVFDSNWNLLGNVMNRFSNDNINIFSYYHTILYNNEIYALGQNGTTFYAMRCKTWLDKLIAYERQVTINGETRLLTYYPFPPLTEEDLDNGYYNQ